MIFLRGSFHHSVDKNDVVSIGKDVIEAFAGQVIQHREGNGWSFKEIMDTCLDREDTIKKILSPKLENVQTVIELPETESMNAQLIEIVKSISGLREGERPNIYFCYKGEDKYETTWLTITELDNFQIQQALDISMAIMDRGARR
jgi:hypothetical protein